MVIGHVYAIGGASGPLKIGWSVDPHQRTKALQPGNPQELSVVASFPGTRSAEARLHWKLKSRKVRGEWFERDAVLTEFRVAA